MMGRIAPNFAAGEWRARLNNFAAGRSTEMLQHCCGLAVDERVRILSEYGRGRSTCFMVLQVNFSFYEALPHKLFGCAHDDVGIARACAKAGIRMYQQKVTELGVDGAVDARRHVHPIVAEACIDMRKDHGPGGSGKQPPLTRGFATFGLEVRAFSGPFPMPDCLSVICACRARSVLSCCVATRWSLVRSPSPAPRA